MKKEDKIINEVMELAKCATPPFTNANNNISFLWTQEGDFSLPSIRYNRLVRDVYHELGLKAKYTEKHIGNLMKDIIGKAIKNPDRNEISNNVRNLINAINTYMDKQTVYLPVVGIQMEIDHFRLGNIDIYNMTSDRFKELNDKIERSISNSSTTQDAKEFLLKYQQELMNNNFQHSTLIEYSVSADPDRAKELAIEETRLVLDIFYYYSSLFLHYEHLKMTLWGETLWAQRLTPVFDFKNNSTLMCVDKLGPLFPFVLNQSNINEMERNGLKILNGVLLNIKKTELEHSLLRSIKWFAVSKKDDNNHIKMLTLITALEALLNINERDTTVTNAICEGISFILSDDCDRRIEIKREMKRLYGLRSSITHGSVIEVYDGDVKLLTDYVFAFIYKIIHKINTINTKKDLHNYIERLKFT